MTLAEAIKEAETLRAALHNAHDFGDGLGDNSDSVKALDIVLAAARSKLPRETKPTHWCSSCNWTGKPRQRPGHEPSCASCGQTAEVIHAR